MQHLHILLLILILISSHSIDTTEAVACHPHQASSLMQLKRSFVAANLSSWRAGMDCCHWEGVTCDMVSGRVLSLDLSEMNLMSYRLDPALFDLTSLTNLNLASNDFSGVRLPESGFERLTDLLHLNFSDNGVSGQIPLEIARLKKLVTLDFSRNYELYFLESSFQTILSNLSNLRELHLDWVKIRSSGSNWSVVLAQNVPKLEILSLYWCGISGSIHSSFSRLRSLKTINLRDNQGLTGKVPEFFAELSSLSILDLSYNYFEGQFPTKIFQLKSLRKLDVSHNPNLSINLPDFPDGNSLETLNVASTNLSYHMTSSFVNLKSLKSLCISTAGASKELSSLIGELPSLRELQLFGSYSGWEKPVLSWVGNLMQLTSLTLDQYDFSQSAPSWIGNLTNLAHLNMWDCNMSMPIPNQIGNLAKLTSLDLIACDFFGQQIPSWIGNLSKLTSLGIFDCGFSGSIPSTIGNLTQLEELEISYNMELNGTIPHSLFALPRLKFFELKSNRLSGSLEDIPAPLSSSLSTIDLSDNQLTGPIPKSFFHLTNLEYLSLESNNLTGTIEFSSIWRLKSLYFLSMSNNLISLTDDEGEIVPLPLLNINYLYLASCSLTKLPVALRYLEALLELDLSNNKISGVIPSWIWENWKGHLQSLNLSSNMFTTLEKSHSLVNMTYLTVLDLSFNRLEGSIKSFICNASKLIILDISINKFSGSVPPCLIESVSLRVLRFRENKFHGVLPENIKEGCKLQSIDVNGNRIEGKLPRSLTYCRDLEHLDVGNNRIVGSFPFWLGILPNLRVLVLRSNKLNGTIRGLQGGYPKNGDHFTKLQIIDLASNNFTGNIYSEWFEHLQSMMKNINDEEEILEYQTNITKKGWYRDIIGITYKSNNVMITKILTTFKVIDFSDNSFGGPIPKSLGKLVLLHGLNLSYNAFMGQIPSQLSSLKQLESLDLSWNKLSGEIPYELTSLTYLGLLNLSYNNLTGRIPQGNQFLAFPNSSFEGNVHLCGMPLSKQCDTPGSTSTSASSPSEHNSSWQDRLYVILLFMFTGLGFGVGFTLAVMFESLWNHKQ